MQTQTNGKPRAGAGTACLRGQKPDENTERRGYRNRGGRQVTGAGVDTGNRARNIGHRGDITRTADRAREAEPEHVLYEYCPGGAARGAALILVGGELSGVT